MTRTLCVKRVEERYVIQLLFVKNVKIGRMNSVSYMYGINVHCFWNVFQRKIRKGPVLKLNPPPQVDNAPPQVDDAPHQVDDDASSASQESHVSPPVVILPLNQELMDANIGLEELQQFQHVDNVVELQLQPVSPVFPPRFLLIHHFLTRLILWWKLLINLCLFLVS